MEFTYKAQEPYGQVPAPEAAVPQLAHRRTDAAAPQSSQQQSPYYAAQSAGYVSSDTSTYSYGGYTPSTAPSSSGPLKEPTKVIYYRHSLTTAVFWVSSLFMILHKFESIYPRTLFWIAALILYSLDLANIRQGLLYLTWCCVVVLTMACGWFSLMETNDEDSGSEVLNILLDTGVTALLLVCAACWLTLQLEWLSSLQSMEQTLHALLPPIASCVSTLAATRWMEEWFDREIAAILQPFVFAVMMAITMLTVGRSECSFGRNQANGDKDHTDFIVSGKVAMGHSALLLATPIGMHLATCIRRILSRYAAMDDWYDLVLAACIPFLLHYMISSMNQSGVCKSPYGLSRVFPPNLRGTLLPMAVSVVTSLALQQRYLIPICHSISYHFIGTSSPTWLLSIYWTGATGALLFCFWVWGRQSATTNEPLFGEFHEDVVQLSLSVAGMALGKAFGLPWNFTPLPILAFLGFSLWVTTRMLRYLIIFLFVLHATGVVVFTYRFAGIDHKMALPVFGLELSLIRFGLVVVLLSILIGLVAGLSVRSSGGIAASFIKKVDLAGVTLIAYTLLLTVLEITLLKRPVPTSELAGVEEEEDKIEDKEMLYDYVWAFVTSAVLIGMTLFMKRVKILSARTSWVVVALAIGKAVSVYIDAAEEEEDGNGTTGTQVLYRALVAALLCIVMFAPRVFLQPVHVKTTTRPKRSHANGMGGELPAGTSRTILLYTFIFLPIALVVAVPYVLFPFANALAGDYGGYSYYSVRRPIPELIGSAISLWGLACLSMLNYYLPDGGGEIWKKLSALAFLMGIGIFFAAPSLGMGIGEVYSNPYASISSLGSKLVSRGKSRTGGWGLLSTVLATLLAITGPLELKERRSASGRKDKLLLFRTMVFSLMFGGGVAWFIIVQSMSETEWIFLILTSIACMVVAFLGTVSAVLGYFIELENFDEVEQIVKMWIMAMPILVPVTGLPQLLSPRYAHPFGAGGWLSTYLAVGSVAALGFSLALRYRSDKNQRTRGVGNLSCVISWVCAIAVLYGRYGVAGLDVNYDVTTVFGLPASVFGTLIVSFILLALEGESSSGARGRVQRVSTTATQKATKPFFGLNLATLNDRNRFVPLIAGSVLVFLLASLYAILMRGSGFFVLFGGSSVARTHEEVFTNVFGGDKEKEHDLAALAEKTIMHSQALAASAKLASSGFWTAGGFLRPMLHLVGVVATLPSHYLQLSQWWLKNKLSTSNVMLALPLNAIPLLLCRGIPSLRVAALIGVIGGIIQLLSLKRFDRQSKMRI